MLLKRLPNLWASALLTDLLISVGVEYWLPMVEEDFADIVKWLPFNPRLRCIEFNGVGVTDAQILALCSAMATQGAVARVQFINNPQASCFEAFLKLAWLSVLDLQGNAIDDAKACRIAAVVEKNTTCTHLFLNHNLIGDTGVASLATALGPNSTMQHLGLCSNQFTTRSVQLLSELLTVNKTLQYLDLDDNAHVSAEAADAVTSALKLRRATPAKIGNGV